MQKLHLVGFTTDHEGLILSTRRGARSGSYRVVVDEELALAVEEARARQLEEAEAEAEVEEIVRPNRVESQLGIKEIQTRLRQGRSVNDVAKAAGVEPAWVERFAAPVFAEQGQVIRTVLGARLHRPRLGLSTMTIGDAVRAGLAERGVSLTGDEVRTAWSTRQLADGRWVVRASFKARGKDVKLRYDLEDATGRINPHDRASAMLGYVAPPAKAPAPKPSTAAAADRPAAKRATVTSGFRRDGTAKATSPAARERERASLAMHKAAVKAAADAEKAKERRERQKVLDAQRAEREAKAEAARKAREEAAAARAKAAAEKAKAAERAKKAAAKAKADAAKAKERERAAAERAKAKAAKQAEAQRKRAEAALAAAERARRSAAKAATKPAAKKAPAKAAVAKASVAKAAPKKVAAKKPAAKKATTANKTPAATSTKAAPAAGLHLARSAPVVPEVPQAAMRGEALPRPRPRPAVREPVPTSAPEIEGQLELPETAGPANYVYGERSTRAVFRAGLVEPTKDPGSAAWVVEETTSWEDTSASPASAALSDDLWGDDREEVDLRTWLDEPAEPVGAPTAVADSPNGAAARPANRPRRTEPLRAT